MRIRTVLVAALALALLGAACTGNGSRAAPPAKPNPDFGIAATSSMVLHESDRTFKRDMQLISRSGAGWIRVDAPWSSLQPAPDRWRWQPLDRLVRAARSAGLQVLLTASYTPKWARPAFATDKHPPTNPGAYGAFCGVLARRYAGQGVHSYEIWNEPNTRTFWSTGADPRQYAALLSAGATAIRSADPRSTIVTAGLAPAPDSPGRGSMSPLTFLTKLYQAGAKGHFDAVGIHPYTYPKDPSAAGTAFADLPALASVMSTNGDGRIPLWATEMGAPTGSSDRSVDLSAQADTVTLAYTAWRESSFPTGPLFWYAHRDRGNDPNNIEDNFGLVRNDFSAKPAYGAYQRMAAGPADLVSGG